MKHRYLATFICICAVALIAGCINYEQEATLNLDGSGSMKIHYWAKESNVMWLSSNKLGFDESKIRAQYQSPTITIKEVKVDADLKDSTKHVRVDLEFKDITKLSEAPGFKDMKITWEDKGETHVLRHELKKDTSASGFGMNEYTLTYSYTLPSEALASNATTVEGKKLIWKYNLSDLSHDLMMTATVKKSAVGGSTTVIIIVVVVVIVIGGILLFARKRSQPQA